MAAKSRLALVGDVVDPAHWRAPPSSGRHLPAAACAAMVSNTDDGAGIDGRWRGQRSGARRRSRVSAVQRPGRPRRAAVGASSP